MRNDARPIGESAKHPDAERKDERGAAEHEPEPRRDAPPAPAPKPDREPTMPANDSTLRTNI
jgi:hypothetical protein